MFLSWLSWQTYCCSYWVMPRLSRQLPKSSVWHCNQLKILSQFHAWSGFMSAIYLVLICRQLCKHWTATRSKSWIESKQVVYIYIYILCLYLAYISPPAVFGVWSRDVLPSSFKIYSLPHQSTKCDPNPGSYTESSKASDSASPQDLAWHFLCQLSVKKICFSKSK